MPPSWKDCTAAEQVRMLLSAIDRGGLLILTCERCGLCYVGHHGSRHCLPCFGVIWQNDTDSVTLTTDPKGNP